VKVYDLFRQQVLIKNFKQVNKACHTAILSITSFNFLLNVILIRKHTL